MRATFKTLQSNRNHIEDILAYYMPVTETGCWIWLGKVNRGGYGVIGYQGVQWIVHRLFFRELRFDLGDMQGDHICNTPCCCNPDHIVPATDRENKLRAGQFKLSDEQVKEILASNELHKDLARKYGVTRGHISNLKRSYRVSTLGRRR